MESPSYIPFSTLVYAGDLGLWNTTRVPMLTSDQLEHFQSVIDDPLLIQQVVQTIKKGM